MTRALDEGKITRRCLRVEAMRDIEASSPGGGIAPVGVKRVLGLRGLSSRGTENSSGIDAR